MSSPNKKMMSPNKHAATPKTKIVSPSKKGGRTISFCWDHKSTMVLLELCAAYLTTHSSKQPFKWVEILPQFMERTGKNACVGQLRNRFDVMKRQYQLLNRLKGETGVGWDPMTGKLDADPKWWEMKIKENPDVKKFRDHGVAPEMDELWEKIFGDSYATGEYCVVPGMDVFAGAANASNPTFYERQGNPPADQDTPMGEYDPLATELMEVDPGFFRNLYITPGEGGSSSSTIHGPTPTTTAPKRTTQSSQFSSPPTSSSSDNKRSRLSRSATMVHDAINELKEEGRRANEMIAAVCAASTRAPPPPPHVVDPDKPLREAYDTLYRMVRDGLIERGTDLFCFATLKVLDETGRKGFMLLQSDDDRLAWLNYQMKNK